jgi:hypothetical protein
MISGEESLEIFKKLSLLLDDFMIGKLGNKSK